MTRILLAATLLVTLAAAAPAEQVQLRFKTYYDSYQAYVFNNMEQIGGRDYRAVRAQLGGSYVYDNYSNNPRFVEAHLKLYTEQVDKAPLYPDKTQYNVSQLTGPRQQQYQELFGRYYDLSTQNEANAEAFGLAVWELKHERGSVLNLNDGSFSRLDHTYDGSVTLANSWLASLDGTGRSILVFELTPILPGGAGRFFSPLLAAGDPDIKPVPAPAVPAALAGLAVCGVIAWARKRRTGMAHNL